MNGSRSKKGAVMLIDIKRRIYPAKCKNGEVIGSPRILVLARRQQKM
jgi:hypothetical protein